MPGNQHIPAAAVQPFWKTSSTESTVYKSSCQPWTMERNPPNTTKKAQWDRWSSTIAQRWTAMGYVQVQCLLSGHFVRQISGFSGSIWLSHNGQFINASGGARSSSSPPPAAAARASRAPLAGERMPALSHRWTAATSSVIHEATRRTISHALGISLKLLTLLF